MAITIQDRRNQYIVDNKDPIRITATQQKIIIQCSDQSTKIEIEPSGDQFTRLHHQINSVGVQTLRDKNAVINIGQESISLSNDKQAKW